MIPFWGGSANASGGNAHSSTERSAKIDQVSGTICSSLKYFERGIVGVCTGEDRQAVVSAMEEHSIEAVGLEVPPYSFEDSLLVRDKHLLVRPFKFQLLFPL